MRANRADVDFSIQLLHEDELAELQEDGSF